MNDDYYWGNTNTTDLLIDKVNSEEMMAGSYITELHIHKNEKPVTIELCNKVSNVSEVCHVV